MTVTDCCTEIVNGLGCAVLCLSRSGPMNRRVSGLNERLLFTLANSREAMIVSQQRLYLKIGNQLKDPIKQSICERTIRPNCGQIAMVAVIRRMHCWQYVFVEVTSGRVTSVSPCNR